MCNKSNFLLVLSVKPLCTLDITITPQVQNSYRVWRGQGLGFFVWLLETTCK